MSLFRPLWLAALVLAVAVVSTARGHGQSTVSPSGVVVGYYAPPAIDRGLTMQMSPGPGSPEAKIRASLQTDNAPAERVGRSGGRYLADRVIVKFRDGTTSSTRASTLSAASVKASDRPAYANFEVEHIDPSEDAEAVVDALRQRPDVEYAQVAHRVYPRFRPNDPLYFRQWNLPDIGMERAWDIQPAAGSAITVAVLDTGVAFTNVTMRYHANAFRLDSEGQVTNNTNRTLYPSLGDLTLAFSAAPELGAESRFVAPRDFIWNNNLPIDLDGHGTHVAGTIGQATNNAVGVAGVAFQVKLMPVKVLDTTWDQIFGAPNAATDDVVARGIRYAADNGAKVINMSLGESGQAGSAPAVEDAMRYAVSKGVFIAVAGGNAFDEGSPTEVLAEIASRLPGVVSVAAANRSHTRATYSSTGPYIELSAPGGSFDDGFGAEGGILQQTLDFGLVETFSLPVSRFTAPRFDAVAYFYLTGTSMATPHVAGVAALLMQQGITDPAVIEEALEATAVDRGKPGRDDEFGFGEIDARAALRGLGLSR